MPSLLPPRTFFVFASALPVIMLGSRLPNKFIAKTHRVYKLSYIQIACVLNNLNCKLTDNWCRLHHPCIRFSNQYSTLHLEPCADRAAAADKLPDRATAADFWSAHRRLSIDQHI